MTRRSNKKGDWLELPVLTGALVGGAIGWNLPVKELDRLYIGAAGAFIGALLVLVLSFLLAHKREDSFYEREWLELTGGLNESKWSLDLLRALEWHRIELLAKAYFETLGIKAELTPFGPDGGVDIKLYSEDSAKPRTFVQCKAHTWAIDVKQVRELYGVMSAEGVPEGIFVTTSTFTSDAKAFANGKINLIDGEDLVHKLRDLPERDSQKLFQVATKGDFMTPTCPACGVKMVDRVSTRDGSHFWGCRNFPSCKQLLNRSGSERY